MLAKRHNHHPEGLLLAGKIGAPHGILGWVRVFSYTSPCENLLMYQPWWLLSRGEWRQEAIAEGKVQGDHLLVQFTDVKTREAAEALTHTEIYIPRAKLPSLKSGEFYWSDLEGLSVKNLQGYVFGTVDYLCDTGANDVMFIKGKKEVCIPYLPEQVVKKVDLDQKEILVDWPEDVS